MFDINTHRLLNHMKQKPGVYRDCPFLKGQKYELVTRIPRQGGTDHQNQHCHTQVKSIFNVSCNTSYIVNLRKFIQDIQKTPAMDAENAPSLIHFPCLNTKVVYQKLH